MSVGFKVIYRFGEKRLVYGWPNHAYGFKIMKYSTSTLSLSSFQYFPGPCYVNYCTSLSYMLVKGFPCPPLKKSSNRPGLLGPKSWSFVAGNFHATEWMLQIWNFPNSCSSYFCSLISSHGPTRETSETSLRCHPRRMEMYKLNNDTSRISVRFIEVLLYQSCPAWEPLDNGILWIKGVFEEGAWDPSKFSNLPLPRLAMVAFQISLWGNHKKTWSDSVTLPPTPTARRQFFVCSDPMFKHWLLLTPCPAVKKICSHKMALRNLLNKPSEVEFLPPRKEGTRIFQLGTPCSFFKRKDTLQYHLSPSSKYGNSIKITMVH